MSNESLKLYTDTLIIETLVSDPKMTKTAQEVGGIVSSIVHKVKDYVGDHIDKHNKVASVINLLTPGILSIMGFPVIGFIVKIAESWFGLNIGKIFEDLASEVKSLILGGAQTTSSAVENLVHRVVSGNAGGAPTQEEFEAAQHKKLSMTLRDAQIYKATIIGMMNNDMAKNAQILSTLGRFIGLKSTTTSALSKIIGWILKVILASAGFMVADDAIHSIMGTPAAQIPGEPTDRSAGRPTAKSTEPSVQIPVSTQTVFKVNPEYSEERMNIRDRWIEPVPSQRIGNEIVQWAKEIYPDLKDVNNDEIMNTVGFKKAVETIEDYNSTNTSDITFMPLMFTSRKKVVDLFIDELAQKAPQFKTAPVPAPPKGPKISDVM